MLQQQETKQKETREFQIEQKRQRKEENEKRKF